MTKKRQIKSNEASSSEVTTKKPTKVTPMTFDEVADIIQSGDSEKLKEVLENRRLSDINMNYSSIGHESLLLVACESGFIECARVLIDHNADINYSTRNCSVLKCACLSENLHMLKFVIERGVTITDSIIQELFTSDKILCNKEVATALVGYIQDVNWTGNNATFLYHACRADNADAVRILLERGAVLSPQLRYLRMASFFGHHEVVKLLLGWNKSTVTITKECVKEALKAASNQGHIEIIRSLVMYGTSVDALNSALCQAVQEQHTEATTLLLDSGADCNASIPMIDINAWIVACRCGSPEIVRLLLAHGADPNGIAASGESPLTAAMRHPVVTKILLEHGADPNRPFPDGSTALLDLVRSQERDYMEAIIVLLGHAADPNLAHTVTGETALMIAAVAEYGELNIGLVKLLFEYGADVTQVNRIGECVLDMLDDGHQDDYSEVRELCTQYIECNKPGAKLLLK